MLLNNHSQAYSGFRHESALQKTYYDESYNNTSKG